MRESHGIVVVGGVFREILDGDSSPRHRYGGSGLISAIAASRMGTQTTLVSFVGAEDAEAVRRLLDAGGVDSTRLMVLPGASGTFVFPTDGEGSARPWPMYRPAEATPRRVPSIPSANVYVIFGAPGFDAIAAGWLRTINADAWVVWDRQGWLSRARDSSGAARLAAKHKVYLANAEEVCEELRVGSVDEAILRLPDLGFHGAVVKLGSRGCLVLEAARGWRVHAVPGHPLVATSTVGSGDVFAGAIAAELARDRTLLESATTANAVAAAYLLQEKDVLAESLSSTAEALVRASTSSST